MHNRTAPPLLIALLLGTIIAITGNSTAYGAPTVLMTKPCADQFKRWQGRSGHKAFALSRPVKSKQACGIAWKASSQRAAVNVALKQCRSIAARSKMPNPRCRVLISQ
jgi:hypothetical protein